MSEWEKKWKEKEKKEKRDTWKTCIHSGKKKVEDMHGSK